MDLEGIRQQLLACQTIEELGALIQVHEHNLGLSDRMKVTGECTMTLRNRRGKVKKRFSFKNLITTAGFTKLALLSSAFTLSQFAYCAIGTGNTAANVADTTLQTEVARSTIITPTNPTALSIKFSFTFAAGTGTGAITESGLLSASSAGTMLNRQVFSVVNKGAGDTLQVDWTITLS